jgi:hypothetical protein
MSPSDSPEKGKNGSDPSAPLVRSVVFGTVLGTSLAAALVYLLLRKTDWSLGLFLGGILSSLNLFSLRWAAGRILHSDGSLWFWNLVRWVLVALACWCLVQISAFCLLGALAGYFWFLLVLSWMGKKT